MEKIQSINYSDFLAPIASRRRPGLTRELTKRQYNAPKESISLAEGMPNDVTFPFRSINVTLKNGESFQLEGTELNQALNYIPSQGYPPLVKQLKEFTYQVHEPPNWVNSEVIITNGSQDGISKSIDMLLQEGDSMLVPNPLYTGTEIVLKPYKLNLLAIPQDQFGMIPQELVNILENCKSKYTEEGGGRRMPRVMYINPTGSNPNGTTLPLERRKEIYKICCQYNIIILEDDPYYFLHFLDVQPVSFLSLDTEGRVLRFDSMSKILSSGLRVGWMTGPKQLIHHVELHIQSSYLHTSTISQVIVDNLLTLWGFDKFLEHCNTVRAYYKARCDITISAMERHLKGLADWTVPTGGMFVWIKVREVSDVYEMLMTRGHKKFITFVPGHAFMADPTQACNYIRASFSKVSLQKIDKAMRLLAELIREEQMLLRRKLENCT